MLCIDQQQGTHHDSRLAQVMAWMPVAVSGCWCKALSSDLVKVVPVPLLVLLSLSVNNRHVP